MKRFMVLTPVSSLKSLPALLGIVFAGPRVSKISLSGVFGAFTVNRRILFVQALLAAVALLILLDNAGREWYALAKPKEARS